MNRSKTPIVRIILLLLVAFALLVMAVLLNLKGIMASSAQSSATLQATFYFPTDYPPAKETLQVGEYLTRQAEAATETVWAHTPSPTGTLWDFSPIMATNPPIPTLVSTPAGDGVIFDFSEGASSDSCQFYGVCAFSVWQTTVNGIEITVYAGGDYSDPSNHQGAVAVAMYGPIGYGEYADLQDGGIFLTPHRSGPVHIVGAQGMRLILVSTQGETFYFDVPGERFVASLTDVVPTATPWPTPTPQPTFIPSATFPGDASHDPDFVEDYSPVYTPLHYILYHAGDEQWFRFHTYIPGTIQVHLIQLPANYDLFVYSLIRVRYIGHDGQSTNPGTADELVTIANAPPDDYMVRVVGVNGAFDPVHPYQLEIDVPVTADDLRTKTASCAADNATPNSLTVKIDHQDWNAFINQVEAQSGKEFSADCAHALIGMATYLLNNPSPTATPTPNS